MWIFSQSLLESSVCILFFVIRKILPKNKLQLFQMILPHLVHQLNPLQHINYRSLQGFPSFVQCFSPLSFLNQLLKYSIWISTLLFLHLNSFIVINIIVKKGFSIISGHHLSLMNGFLLGCWNFIFILNFCWSFFIFNVLDKSWRVTYWICDGLNYHIVYDNWLNDDIDYTGWTLQIIKFEVFTL